MMRRTKTSAAESDPVPSIETVRIDAPLAATSASIMAITIGAARKSRERL